MTATVEADDAVEESADHPDRRRLILVLVVATVVVAVVATWLIAFSSVFGVRTVTVRGTSVLSAAQVRAAAKVVRGTPLVRVDTATIARRVQRLPDVASARVSTSFPSTVTITVIERRPVAYVATGSGATLVDRTGRRYRSVATAPSLPRLVAVPSAATDAALASVAAALPADVRAEVRSIQALDPNSITLLLRGNRLVRWGDASRSADKARVLPVLLRGKNDQIDVTDPDQPFTH